MLLRAFRQAYFNLDQDLCGPPSVSRNAREIRNADAACAFRPLLVHGFDHRLAAAAATATRDDGCPRTPRTRPCDDGDAGGDARSTPRPDAGTGV